ncbi:MAG: hypothetical protein LBH44_11310 [Treponema sp.]|jgi:hypothetical protein|nr:hypothetical protein [Treponema sp.]
MVLNMEAMVFQSPKKHRIIAIKRLLADNNIQVTSIKLYIQVEWTFYHRKTGSGITERRKSRDELNIPIEEFNGKLNDAQTFELYVDDKHKYLAKELIENICIETLFDDCIFKSNNYDEVFDKYLLLRKNNIQCDDVFINDEEYLLFIDPENRDEALSILEPKKENREYIYEYKEIKQRDNSFVKEYKERNILKYFVPIIIVLLILFFKIENEHIFEIIINKIKYIFEIHFNIKQ